MTDGSSSTTLPRIRSGVFSQLCQMLFCPRWLILVTNYLNQPVQPLTHFASGPPRYAAQVAQIGLHFPDVGTSNTREMKSLWFHVVPGSYGYREKLVCPPALVSFTHQQPACGNSNCYSKHLISQVTMVGEGFLRRPPSMVECIQSYQLFAG